MNHLSTGIQAENTKKDGQTTRGIDQSCHRTQVHPGHYHAQPSIWETKLDTLLDNIRLTSNSNTNKPGIKSSSVVEIETPKQTQKDRKEHNIYESPLQATHCPVRSNRRPPLTLKMNQAWHPPCQPQQVDDVHGKSLHGSIEHTPNNEEDVAVDYTHVILPSQTGNAVSSNSVLLVPDHTVNKVPSIRRQKRTSSITVSDASTIVRSNTSSSSRSSTTATSPASGKLVLSQRLQTMDVRETIEYLREQGYTTTFIAEHLSVRGYNIELGGEAGMYRKYHKAWVQGYLDKVDK